MKHARAYFTLDRFFSAFCVIIILFAVWFSTYVNQKNNWHSEIKACVRSQSDRVSNVAAWYGVYRHDLYRAGQDKGQEHTNDLIEASTAFEAAKDLNQRVSPSLSLRVGGTYPLGVGRVVCSDAFPKPSLF